MAWIVIHVPAKNEFFFVYLYVRCITSHQCLICSSTRLSQFESGNKNKGNGNGTGLAWKASRTALQRTLLSHTHTLFWYRHTTWLQSRKVQNNIVNYNKAWIMSSFLWTLIKLNSLLENLAYNVDLGIHNMLHVYETYFN